MYYVLLPAPSGCQASRQDPSPRLFIPRGRCRLASGPAGRPLGPPVPPSTHSPRQPQAIPVLTGVSTVPALWRERRPAGLALHLGSCSQEFGAQSGVWTVRSSVGVLPLRRGTAGVLRVGGHPAGQSRGKSRWTEGVSCCSILAELSLPFQPRPVLLQVEMTSGSWVVREPADRERPCGPKAA